VCDALAAGRLHVSVHPSALRGLAEPGRIPPRIALRPVHRRRLADDARQAFAGQPAAEGSRRLPRGHAGLLDRQSLGLARMGRRLQVPHALVLLPAPRDSGPRRGRPALLPPGVPDRHGRLHDALGLRVPLRPARRRHGHPATRRRRPEHERPQRLRRHARLCRCAAPRGVDRQPLEDVAGFPAVLLRHYGRLHRPDWLPRRFRLPGGLAGDLHASQSLGAGY